MSTLAYSLNKYRVAALQYEPTLGEKEKNVRDLLDMVEEAAQHEARLIVLPEMATTGYCWTSRAEIAPYVETIPGPTTERFQQLATRYSCFIAIGLPEVDPSTNVYYDSLALLGPEGLIGTYRKIHSYITEPRWARDGDLGIPVWDTPLGRLSGLINTDAMYFEAARIPALHNADVVLLPTNWVDEKCPSSWWMARALENGVYFIAANRHGRERGIQFSGGSCILNPDGSIQAYLDTGNGIVYGEVDLKYSRDKRWGGRYESKGDRLEDRRPAEYIPVTQNSYLWEPLRYHSLYALGELPIGQLSCVGIIQANFDTLLAKAPTSHTEIIQALSSYIKTAMQDNAPASPDVLVLPELLLPGPQPWLNSGAPVTQEVIRAHFQQGAIEVPGPETTALVALAEELQISMVLGVAERAGSTYYNTVLLIDPEGIYGTYRKLHLTQRDRLWATPGNLSLQTFDTPTGRIGLATGYDVLFPETLRVLAGQGADLVCAPTLLDFPDPFGLAPTMIPHLSYVAPDGYDPTHFLIWRVRAAEHNVYLAVANWNGQDPDLAANGMSGIYAPACPSYPWPEVVADDDEPGLLMMTIDTREQRTGRRTTHILGYSPGDMAGSLTGELAYNILDSIPGNVVRSKPLLRKRQPFWYLDLVKPRK
ncbi:amidohydrolase [Ktedonosporobacter rubrisoli]|uniref:Amidohydrolase n=1 Tax=Ktedonosporobacter rubrisoli TaxID=2509675 RepID=A0A4P6K0A9_KTERU|nr:nitrilase-related carbon-nitrogen hydrolase [Ktedonosporobacter rubrisoli]QBD81464.1 amidohydrolase [Ktedonosporobacter rubrisoli]